MALSLIKSEPYEKQYIENLASILRYGEREANSRTGVETYRLPATIIQVDVKKDFPILRSKYVAWKTAIEELLWIYIKCDNDTKNLSSKIWAKNAYEDGTIGKSYGYQAGKRPVVLVNGKKTDFRSQLDYVISTLKADPSSRQAVIDLWDPEDLSEMALPPCILNSVWTIINGRLNVLVTQRSADYPLGVPFDTFQFAVLMYIVARELGVEPGILTHNFGDSHIYLNQVPGVVEQLRTYMKDAGELSIGGFFGDPYSPVKLKITDKPYTELTVDDFELVNYTPGPKIKYELN